MDTQVGTALSKAMDRTHTTEALILAQAAKFLRSELFNDFYAFDGNFKNDCQEKSVPLALQLFINMLLEGPGITERSDRKATPACLSIAQQIKHNAVKRTRAGEPARVRHDREKETPFPLYVGLLIHAHTRQKGLNDKLFDAGVSVSSKRIKQLSQDLCNAVCAYFKKEGVIVPTGFNKSVFTTGAVDNVDYNPSSSTAKGSIHGTGISLFQHPDFDGQGQAMEPIDFSSGSAPDHLPDFYLKVPPVTKPPKDPEVPPAVQSLLPDATVEESVIQQETGWLQYVQKHCNDAPTKDLCLS